jgi:hypothetical protein
MATHTQHDYRSRSINAQQPTTAQPSQRLSQTELYPVSNAKHRLFYLLIAGGIGLLLGAGVDLAIALIHAITQPASTGAIIWLFVWLLGGLGALIGGVYGVQSADFFMGIFRQPNDSQALSLSQFWLRTAMRVTAIAIVLWTIALMLV